MQRVEIDVAILFFELGIDFPRVEGLSMDFAAQQARKPLLYKQRIT